MGMATNYAGRVAGRVGLAAWRRKSTLLVGAAALVLLVLCLQYNALRERERERDGSGVQAQSGNKLGFDDSSVVLNGLDVDADDKQDGGVKFVQSDRKDDGVVREREREQGPIALQLPADQPSRDAVARRLAPAAPGGAPAEPREPRPYVPPQRLAHFDLKGAPPKVSYMKKVFALLRQVGATGVLLEWEDTFPFWGPLAHIAASNAYSRAEVAEILQAAKENQLEVMPLVQTFGHVEFALKTERFAPLREVPESPQALCPSNNASMEFVAAMIDQVMELHPGVRFLHIGCDEVFQMGECPRCKAVLRENLFLSHVARVATYVRQKYSNSHSKGAGNPRGTPVTPIIWHDMLQHLPAQSMEEFRIGELVEPMVWVYAEDVYRFVPSMVWDKFATVFPRVWAASAFKGAFGETMYIPNVKRHLENNLRWLEVMSAEGPKFKEGFQGLVVTGWQRYDHFAVLCELLPAAIPSLAVNLLTITNGFINPSLRVRLNTALNCAAGGGAGAGDRDRDRPGSSTYNSPMFLNLNSDPFLWDMFNRCFFPGVPFFRLTYRLHGVERDVKDFLHSLTRAKGWMTDFNVRRNFSSPLRVDELMMDQPRIYNGLTALAHQANDALSEVFDAHTIAEWVEQRIYPDVKRLEKVAEEASALKSRRVWPRRPLPPLPELRRLGVTLPETDVDSDSNNNINTNSRTSNKNSTVTDNSNSRARSLPQSPAR